jgi:hypothetical protein
MISILINALGIIFDIFSWVFALYPDFRTKVGNEIFPFVNNLSTEIWIVLSVIIILLLIIYNVGKEFYIEKRRIEKLPFIKIKDFDTENVFLNINSYGTSSFIAKGLTHDRTLIYLDFINDPKIKMNNNALNVSVSLEYYEGENRYWGKEHYGRWIEQPEHELGKNHTYTDIKSDGISVCRLGIGYIEGIYGDIIYLLDSEKTDLSSHGVIMNPPYLDIGKYIVVAKIFGNNLSEIPPVVFEIFNLENEKVEIKKLNNGSKIANKLEKKNKPDASIWKRLRT